MTNSPLLRRASIESLVPDPAPRTKPPPAKPPLSAGIAGAPPGSPGKLFDSVDDAAATPFWIISSRLVK
jgi:hypothetical protein